MANEKKKFVRAEEGPNNSVVYYDEEGNKWIRHWKQARDRGAITILEICNR